MKVLIYDIAMHLYQFVIKVVSPFNKKAELWLEGRQNYFINLQNKMNKKTGPIIWFHCASLGEFEQTRTVIERVKQSYPEYNILLTFFSPSGYEVRKNYDKADFVFYLPLDTPFNAQKFVRVVNPRIALFAKYEFWYHYIEELDKKKIPVISFSAIFRKDQVFFKSYGDFFITMLKKIKMIFVQNQESVELLKSIGISKVELAGDTRFDRVKELYDNKKSFPLIEKFKNNQKVLVAGSTWPADLEVLINIINDSSLDLKFIIAPHEIEQDQIANIEKSVHKKVIRYSSLNDNNAQNSQVLIIDNIGMLSSLYQYGEYAYIGGAFGKGLHNILEAATYGMPIYFGPKYDKFKEATDLVNEGCAFSVMNGEIFSQEFKKIFNNEVERKRISEKTRAYVQFHIGASDKIFNYCRQFLK